MIRVTYLTEKSVIIAKYIGTYGKPLYGKQRTIAAYVDAFNVQFDHVPGYVLPQEALLQAVEDDPELADYVRKCELQLMIGADGLFYIRDKFSAWRSIGSRRKKFLH